MKYGSIDDIVRDLEEHPVERSGSIYHPIPFPEFDHLTTSTNASGVSAKLEMVRHILQRKFPEGIGGRTILDVGANAGLFTFSLAQEGAHVTAYEPHPRYGPIGNFLARAKTTTVDWHAAPFDREAARERTYDAALMLSTLQWITQGNVLLDEGKRILEEVSKSVGLLIFELGVNSGKSAITTRRLNHVGFIHDLLKTSTSYPHIQLAGSTKFWNSPGSRYVFACSHERIDLREPWYSFLKHIPL